METGCKPVLCANWIEHVFRVDSNTDHNLRTRHYLMTLWDLICHFFICFFCNRFAGILLCARMRGYSVGRFIIFWTIQNSIFHSNSIFCSSKASCVTTSAQEKVLQIIWNNMWGRLRKSDMGRSQYWLNANWYLNGWFVWNVPTNGIDYEQKLFYEPKMLAILHLFLGPSWKYRFSLHTTKKDTTHSRYYWHKSKVR